MADYTKYSRYTVSKDGKVYSLDKKLMRTFIDKDGYEVVGLRDDSHKRHLVKVHRLVATRFIPTDDYSLTVNHKDGNKRNNSVGNLEWLSSADNLRHSWRILKRVHFTKPVVNSKGEIFKSLKEASEKYGVSIQAISNCAKGKAKSSAGLEWRFTNGIN